MKPLTTLTIYDSYNKPYKGIFYADKEYAGGLCFKYGNCKTSVLAFTNNKNRDLILIKNNPHVVDYLKEHYVELFI